MYVSPINNRVFVSNYKKNNQVGSKNLSFKKTQLLLSTPSFSKKISRCLNTVLLMLLPIAGFQFQNQIDKIEKEYVQYVPLVKDFDTQEGALNYSIERITERLNDDEPREYSIHINDRRHSIISEVLGNDSTVLHFSPGKHLLNRITTLDYSYTSLHGHPASSNGATSTFSFQDFKTFVGNNKCSATYVVNKDGKYCRLEKTENYKEISEKELEKLEEEYDYHVYYSWDTKKIIYNNQGEKIFELVDYPGMHVFWDNIAKRYGMNYVTTYGSYGLYEDIYKNGYHEAFYVKEEIVNN